MKYLFSEINPPNCINCSIIIRLDETSSPVLVLSKLNKLEFYTIYNTNEVISLRLIECVNMDIPVCTLGKFKSNNSSKEWLLIYTETHRLFVMGYHNNKFVLLQRMQFDTKAQQHTIDTSPILAVDTSEEPSYFIVHNFQGLIHLFTLNHRRINELLINRHAKKRKQPESDIWDLKTFSIGNIVVQKMVILNGDLKVIAILYRDFNYNFSMRFYEVDQSNNFNLIKQFEEFEEPPTDLIAAKQGGVLVLTNLHIFYFPSPDVRFFSLINDSIPYLSINEKEKVITKMLHSINDSEAYEHLLTHHAIIDESRILVISNTGVTFILYFDTESSKINRKITIKDLQFIKLGLTTIPNSVHYIDDATFFASSRLSQSILFKVIPTEPYIDICQNIASSPPVLNIEITQEENITLLACQGGYDSGEFRKYTNEHFTLKLLETIETSNAMSLSVLKKSFTILVNKVDKTCEQYRLRISDATVQIEFLKFRKFTSVLEELQEESSNSSINFKKYASKNIKNVKALKDGYSVFVADDIEVVIFKGIDRLQSFKSQRHSEISDIDIEHISKDIFIALVSFWDGSYEMYSISSSTYELIFSESVRNSCSIFSGLITYNRYDSNNVWVILSTSDGDLIQFQFDIRNKKKIEYKEFSLHFKDLPFKLVKSDSNEVVAFNTNSIVGMWYDKTLNFYKLSRIFESRYIMDVKFVNNDLLCVLLDSKDVHLYELSRRTEKSMISTTIFSQLLNIKSIHLPSSNYSIIISIENKINRVTSELQKYSYLRLVDRKSMIVLDTFQFPNDLAVDLVDLTYIPESDHQIPINSFVAVANSKQKDEVLLLFHIINKKITQLPKANIIGVMESESLKLSSISILNPEDLTFVVAGNINFIVRLQYDSNFEWVICTHSVFLLPTLGLDAISKNGVNIFGDMLKGLFRVKLSEINDGKLVTAVQKLEVDYESSYITSLDLAELDEDKVELIVGDSIGNLTSIVMDRHSDDSKQELAFNVGDQINVCKAFQKSLKKLDFTSVFDKKPKYNLAAPLAIVGTVNGALYQLSKLLEPRDNIENTLSKCFNELSTAYLETMSITVKDGAEERCSRYNSRLNWKFLYPEDDGSPASKDFVGVWDTRLVKRWLSLDSVFRENKADTFSSRQLKILKKDLNTCYRNKCLLEMLVYQLEADV